jgi:glycosyltransferase involved in cell wall biosynthesis
MLRKLVYSSTAIVPSTQANSIQIMKMCNALCRFNFDVTLLAGTLPGKKGIDVFDYYGIENKFSIIRKITGSHRGSTFLLSLRHYTILKKLAASQEDILFYGRDVLALYILAQAGRKVIYETHDTVKKGPRSWAEKKLIKSNYLSKIVFISEELRKVYNEKYGELLANKNTVVAPDAADVPPDFSDSFSLNGNLDFNACYIGGFHKGRGIELILEVASGMSEVGFHLFGGTDNQIRQIKENIPPNVYLYKHIPPAQTYKIRNAADVLLMPYQNKVMVAQNASETSRWMSPIKLFEYMSSKKPIISSNNKVLQEVLQQKRNCLLCEPDNVKQWTQAIKSIKEDKVLYTNIAQTAYKDFIDNYTWDKRIKRILFSD